MLWIVPTTSSFSLGVVVPIPRLPLILLKVNLSIPPCLILTGVYAVNPFDSKRWYSEPLLDILKLPFTSSVVSGLLVPIPTLPSVLIRILSELFVLKVIWLLSNKPVPLS